MTQPTTYNRQPATLLKFFFLSLFVVGGWLLVGATSVAYAQQTPYTLLQPIPLGGAQSGDSRTANAKTYMEGLFQLTIAIATGLAVLTIIFGGIKYMSTDAFAGKSEAKTTIEHALWGLLLAISAWLILNTISPNLTTFNLNIPKQPPITAPPPVVGGGGGAGACLGCVIVGEIPHKPAPSGCAPPGPCMVTGELKARLTALYGREKQLLVTESYPPTLPTCPTAVRINCHTNPCHASGSCVDATIIATNPQDIKSFINNVSAVNLNAQFETTSEARATAIRAATGLPVSQVKYVPGITGEHFSIYLR